MPRPAQITSIEALESFRADLIIYIEKARRCVDEISGEVVQTRLWLQNNRLPYWESEVRRCAQELDRSQQELSAARMAVIEKRTIVEQMAVKKASDALQEAQAKLGLVKQWNRQYDSRVEPLAKPAEKMREVLMSDMPKAVAWLAQATKILAAYTETAPREKSDAATPVTPDSADDKKGES